MRSTDSATATGSPLIEQECSRIALTKGVYPNASALALTHALALALASSIDSVLF